ncbi:hypothetical protein [Perigonia lusca single nucleopolyhedrovirus]|uniref:Uncharacterized protein n=1 Tax=Perigonia lusca single nucleopolyhedrovirus TaxID=1675865 RepID=A0A0M3WNN4_9ABAC|nr:hypothetical protein [Perigonia lusca single nucleopolyhedrovirus]AKN80666.1 hypothetical protein [Perigonia lusca single nucleopolyhedrovirus]
MFDKRKRTIIFVAQIIVKHVKIVVVLVVIFVTAVEIAIVITVVHVPTVVAPINAFKSVADQKTPRVTKQCFVALVNVSVDCLVYTKQFVNVVVSQQCIVKIKNSGSFDSRRRFLATHGVSTTNVY